MAKFDEQVEALLDRHPANEILRVMAGVFEHAASYHKKDAERSGTYETHEALLHQAKRLRDAAKKLRDCANKIDM